MLTVALIILGVILFPLLILIVSLVVYARRTPHEPYEPEEPILFRVRTMLAQKRYSNAFALAVASAHQSPWNWLVTEQRLYGELARRTNFEEEALLDLAREALLGMNAVPFAGERRACFDDLTDHWEKLRRTANLILNGGNPGVTEAEWELLRMDMIKLRLRLMELDLPTPSEPSLPSAEETTRV